MIDQFAAHQSMSGFTPPTIKRRTLTLRQFARHLDPRTFPDATLVDVEEFLATFTAARTRHAYRSDLRAFYAWARRHRLLDVDPTAELGSIKVPKSLPRPLNGVAVCLLERGQFRTRVMTALGLFAGLRCCEIAALHGDDISFEHQLLVVRDGKGGKDRAIDIHPKLGALLAVVPRDGFLFPGRRGHAHVSPDAVSATIRRHMRECGVAGTAHQLRHTFGTEMTRRTNGNLMAVAALMGHGSIETTRGYVGWTGESAAIVRSMFTDDDDRPAA